MCLYVCEYGVSVSIYVGYVFILCMLIMYELSKYMYVKYVCYCLSCMLCLFVGVSMYICMHAEQRK